MSTKTKQYCIRVFRVKAHFSAFLWLRRSERVLHTLTTPREGLMILWQKMYLLTYYYIKAWLKRELRRRASTAWRHLRETYISNSLLWQQTLRKQDNSWTMFVLLSVTTSSSNTPSFLVVTKLWVIFPDLLN